MKIAMRKIFFLMMLGCIFVACKSENTNGDAAVEPQYQASVSVHRTYSGSELKGIIESVCTENDTVGLKILKGIEYYAVVLRDTAQVKEYIEKIAAFEKAVECDYLLKGDGYSLCVYDLEPLIAETVIMAAEPVDMMDDQMASFQFADSAKWEKITSESLGRRLAVLVNGKLKSSPVVQSPITEGRCSTFLSADDLEACKITK